MLQLSGLEKELENVTKNVSSLSKSGDVFAEQEDQIADQISELKQRYSTNQFMEFHFPIFIFILVQFLT